jgi:very-short-patch-repair endonuclease
MLPEIDAVLARAGGVATRRRLLQVVTRHQFDHEVRTGHLAVPFRGAFCRPWNADFLQDRAALVSVGPPAALSHLTAIHRWQVWHAPAEAVQLVVLAARCPRPRPGIQLHRVATMPPLLRVDGLPTVDLPHALVQSWPLLPSHDRRAPVIEAVRRHLTTRAALAATLRVTTRLPHRAEFDELLRLLDDGCESELEIWGYLDVFDFPGLRHGTRQLLAETPAGRFRTDLGYEAERVAIELDGARYHSSREQRERDMRRDAAFASIDWLTLRFSHHRLHHDVPGCRRDTLAALAARRRAA